MIVKLHNPSDSIFSSLPQLLSSGDIRIKPKTAPEPLEAEGEATPTAQAPASVEEQW